MSIDHLAHLRSEARAFAAIARSSDPALPVPSCPGWDLGKLVTHLGRIHRWATEVATTRQNPGSFPKVPEGDVLAWYEEGVPPLLRALEELDPAETCWNFSVAPQVGGFWARRQAQETAMHRVDAELASGSPGPIDAALAADGIDELFEVFIPTRLAGKDGIDIGGSLHLHCTDVDGEWTVRTDDGIVRVAHEHAKGDAAVRGPASDLLAVLWRRLPPTHPTIERFGETAVLDRWLALPAP